MRYLFLLPLVAAMLGVSVHAAIMPAILPPPQLPQCSSFSISLNLTYAFPPSWYLAELNATDPVLYKSMELVANTVPPWLGLADENLTLDIWYGNVSAFSEATSNSTGGVTWRLCIRPSELAAHGNWTVAIGMGERYPMQLLFGFRTGNESLQDVLGNLSKVGGVLVEGNKAVYELWHRVGDHYGVPMPMHVSFYTWLGDDLSPNEPVKPLPQFFDGVPFPQYGNDIYLSLAIAENGHIESSHAYQANLSVGAMTEFGYSIYGIPRLLPYGPIQYNSSISLLGNGTIVDSSCLVNYIYLTEVWIRFLNPAYGNYVYLTLYDYESQPTSMLLVNGSLIIGGYLKEYDFFNNSITTVSPPLSGEIVSYCRL